MLGTIRHYSRDRLRASGQWQEAHDRHAAHFLEFAEPATAGLAGPSQVTWLDRLEAEHDNLGAAMSWFLDQDQPALAHQLGAATWRFWWLRGHAEEFARYGRAIVANGEKLPPGQLGYAQNGLGLMLIASGDPAGAQELFEQALALFRQLGDKLGIAISAGSLGHLTALRRDYAEASKLLAESLALHQELGNKVSVALQYNFLGQIPLSQGDNDAAARLLRQGLEAARRVPDRFPLLISLYDLALSSQARGDLAGAAGLLREGLSVASDAGDESCVGYYLQRLAALAAQREDPGRAVRLLAAADAVLQAAGTGWLLAYVAGAPREADALPELRSPTGGGRLPAGVGAGRRHGTPACCGIRAAGLTPPAIPCLAYSSPAPPTGSAAPPPVPSWMTAMTSSSTPVPGSGPRQSLASPRAPRESSSATWPARPRPGRSPDR